MSEFPLANDNHHSGFGGMWIDRADFEKQLICRLEDRRIPPAMEGYIRDFERDGYVVFSNAASEDALAEFEGAISTAFRDGHKELIGQLPGSGAHQRVSPGMDRRGTRIVDSFAVIAPALSLLSGARLAAFLRVVFDERPLLFQSISFDTGSGQGLHQDTAYVVLDRPMEMLACWIALEDVQPGSGELQYMVGSHRLGDFPFGGKKHWNLEQDGVAAHDNWCSWILDEGEKRGLPIKRFMAKRGDILIWHADLAHGGSPITNPELTRKSLIGHFCPISAQPYFMVVSPERSTILQHGEISYASWHYDLRTTNARGNDRPSS
jgi:ectoine hydroxylase-related dioxygenase (phytanoyl-CoA dioxygenase family)